MIDYTVMSADELRGEAQQYQHDNQSEGDPGYCEASNADWRYELVAPKALSDVFTTQQKAKEWLDAELDMDRSEQLGRDWSRLLTEQIEEPVTLLARNGRVYVWDGWHRIAAAIIKGESIKAIVGYPRA